MIDTYPIRSMPYEMELSRLIKNITEKHGMNENWYNCEKRLTYSVEDSPKNILLVIAR